MSALLRAAALITVALAILTAWLTPVTQLWPGLPLTYILVILAVGLWIQAGIVSYLRDTITALRHRSTDYLIAILDESVRVGVPPMDERLVEAAKGVLAERGVLLCRCGTACASAVHAEGCRS